MRKTMVALIMFFLIILLTGCDNNENDTTSKILTTSDAINSHSTTADSSTNYLFSVTWKNWDGTVLETDTNVLFGTIPEYNGDIPSKKSENNNIYYNEFDGWDKEISKVLDNVIYTAKYKMVYVKYNINFYDYKNDFLGSSSYNYGDLTKKTNSYSYLYDDQYDYFLLDWYADVKRENLFEFGNEIYGNIQVYGKYTQTLIPPFIYGKNSVTGLGMADKDNVIIPKTYHDAKVTLIDEYAFKDTEIKNIEFSNNITTIEKGAFLGCSSLINVYFDGKIEEWNKINFKDEFSNPMKYAENLFVLNENGNIDYNGNKYSLVIEFSTSNSEIELKKCFLSYAPGEVTYDEESGKYSYVGPSKKEFEDDGIYLDALKKQTNIPSEINGDSIICYATEKNGYLEERDDYFYLNQLGFELDVATSVDIYVRINIQDSWLLEKIINGKITESYIQKNQLVTNPFVYSDTNDWYYDEDTNYNYYRYLIDSKEKIDAIDTAGKHVHYLCYKINPDYFYSNSDTMEEDEHQSVIVQIAFTVEIVQANRVSALWGIDLSILNN